MAEPECVKQIGDRLQGTGVPAGESPALPGTLSLAAQGSQPFIVTELTSLSAVESGMELATERPAAKPLPKIEMSEPGDTVVLTELIV